MGEEPACQESARYSLVVGVGSYEPSPQVTLAQLRTAFSNAAHEAAHTLLWGSVESGKSSLVLHFTGNGTYDRGYDETSLVVSTGERVSEVDLVQWYANQKLPELLNNGSSSPSSLVILNSCWAGKRPEPDVQPWTEAFQSDRWLERSGLVTTWVEPGWWSLPSALDLHLWQSGDQAEGQYGIRVVDPWAASALSLSRLWPFSWVTRFEAFKHFQERADALVYRLARYVRRKLFRTASRVRHVRPQVQRPAVRPLTTSVTAHAPPRSSCIEGRGALRRSPLAA